MSKTSLGSLFKPRSVAIIGASEKNPWAGLVMRTLHALDFGGPVHIVNRRGGEVLGRATLPSASAIGEPVDSAFIMVPAAALPETLEDMAAAGIRHGVVVTSGFAELGAEGTALQDRIFGRARELGLHLMGPNSLGFINLVDRVALSAVSVDRPLLPNPRVAVISQSGATSALIAGSAHATGISVSHVVALGNEAMIDMADVIDYMVDDQAVRSIAIFAESVRRPEAFLWAAKRALAAEKPIVMLKVGLGELAAQVAHAHTGALVGDDRVFDAICRELCILRVDTVEQLLQTADMVAYTGVLGEGGFGVASMSGGTCEMIADLGEAAGVPFATFSRDTAARLKAVLADYATVQNPLDVTGGVLSDFSTYGEATAIVGADPSVALVAACFDIPQSVEREQTLHRPILRHLSSGIKRAGVPGFLLLQSYLGTSDHARDLIREEDLPQIAMGLGTAMNAVGAAFRWSAGARASKGERQPARIALVGAHPAGERETLDYLASRGIPVIPATIARSAGEAVAAARDFVQPVVLKILSSDIQHKTEIGGVALDLKEPEAIAAEYEAMVARVQAGAPAARIEGVIVSPMRKSGIELIVGVARDPAWGLMLAVGIGGVWVELLADADLHTLPVTPPQVQRMLGRLKAAKLLDGYRGQLVANRARIAEVVAAVGDAALALGPDLMSLEVNPLLVSGDHVECLDALTIWRD